MSRTASNLRQQQLSLARKLRSARLGLTHLDPLDVVRDGLLLAELTLELDARLCAGTPFPAAWIAHASTRRPPERLTRS